MLHDLSNGLDIDSIQAVKRIGNSTTTIRALAHDEDVKMTLYVLAESVGQRMRQQRFKRDNQL